MLKWSRHWPRILCGLLGCLAMVAVVLPAGAADTWTDDATPVFRHVEMPSDIEPTTMLQDRDGLIWIGSQTGLASWDGYHFRTYIANPSKAGSLPSPFINALDEDREGRLWVGTDSGGLARLDKVTGRFWTLGAGPRGLSSARVFALATDGPDGLWVGTQAGLDRLDITTGEVRRQGEGSISAGLPARRVNALLADRSGNLWVGTMDGIYVLRKGAQVFVPVAGLTGAAIEVWQLTEDSDGRVWVGTRTTGAFVIEPGATTAQQLRDGERSDGKGVETDWVVSIVDAGNNHMWLGTWTQGIVQVDTRTRATRRLRHDSGLPGSLGGDDVSALLRDRSGVVWAGGPNLFDSIDPAQRAISTLYGSDGHLIGGKQAEVTAVLVRPNGSVWLGSASGGVDIVLPNGEHGGRLVAQDGLSRTEVWPGFAKNPPHLDLSG